MKNKNPASYQNLKGRRGVCRTPLKFQHSLFYCFLNCTA
uniref:Uncharacterized protein n=1 Tax=Rhizophora mucronata TaxID=61149 RepID=A0A2P2PWU6_RHIMU